MTNFERKCLVDLLLMLESEIKAGDISAIDTEIWGRISDEKKKDIKKSVKTLSMIIR